MRKGHSLDLMSGERSEIIIIIIITIIIIIIIIEFFTSVELLVYSNVFKTPIWKRMLNLRQIDSRNTTPGQEHF